MQYEDKPYICRGSFHRFLAFKSIGKIQLYTNLFTGISIPYFKASLTMKYSLPTNYQKK